MGNCGVTVDSLVPTTGIVTTVPPQCPSVCISLFNDFMKLRNLLINEYGEDGFADKMRKLI